MYDHTFFSMIAITRSDIAPLINWAVNLVIAGGHFNLHQGFVLASIMMSTNLFFTTRDETMQN